MTSYDWLRPPFDYLFSVLPQDSVVELDTPIRKDADGRIRSRQAALTIASGNHSVTMTAKLRPDYPEVLLPAWAIAEIKAPLGSADWKLLPNRKWGAVHRTAVNLALCGRNGVIVVWQTPVAVWEGQEAILGKVGCFDVLSIQTKYICSRLTALPHFRGEFGRWVPAYEQATRQLSR